MLKKWAKAGTQNDTLLIMQINHAGKQSPAVVNKTPLVPSTVPLVGMDGFINPLKATCTLFSQGAGCFVFFR